MPCSALCEPFSRQRCTSDSPRRCLLGAQRGFQLPHLNHHVAMPDSLAARVATVRVACVRWTFAQARHVVCGAAQVTTAEQDFLPTPCFSALQPAATQQAAGSALTPLPPVCSLPALVIESVSWQQYSLPLQKPLTTGANMGHRHGFLLKLRTEPHNDAGKAHAMAGHASIHGAGTSAARDEFTGVGEVCGLFWPLMQRTHPTTQTEPSH